MKKIWENPLAGSLTNQERVSTPEMLIGYLIGPFGAMLSSGIFTSFLQAYLGDVLGLSALPVGTAAGINGFYCGGESHCGTAH